MKFQKEINIGKKKISKESSVYFVAEIGFNFLNNINLAYEMISAAKEALADAVKFQSFIADKIVLPSHSFYEMFKKYELSKENHFKIKEYCDKIGIEFFTTPFDTDILDFIVDELKVNVIKIASGDLTFYPLLLKAAKTKLPIILATGLATYKEIENSLRLIKKYNDKIILLHCVSNYPLEYKNANLAVIKKLRKMFNCLVGFSDHSAGYMLDVIAVSLGAKLIEKHFTINKNLENADNKISMEPAEFKKMVTEVREIEQAIGNSENKPIVEELEMKKIARRSIYTAQPILENEKITFDKIKIVRPYVEDSEPMQLTKILNKKAKKNYQKDEVIFTK
ncbi:MAG TPA: N-acetylneuraminate synthase family protein [bacterium]|nr:N-acetylneuraminate synthase family protein [bacterium]HPQ18057.1 N-acetylneuraminate synthase family protein [bacterium]